MEAKSVPITTKTVGASIGYCEYLAAKGYASTTQVEPWKTAIKRVFEAVEGPDYEALDWSSVDLDDYLSRFRVLAQSKYKIESIDAYVRRVRNALDSHAHFIDEGRPPAPRGRAGANNTKKSEPAEPKKSVEKDRPRAPQRQAPVGVLELAYPLGPNRYVTIQYPPNLTKRDIDRIVQVIGTLEGPPELPMQTAA